MRISAEIRASMRVIGQQSDLVILPSQKSCSLPDTDAGAAKAAPSTETVRMRLNLIPDHEAPTKTPMYRVTAAARLQVSMDWR
jgi:hypothetical protein